MILKSQLRLVREVSGCSERKGTGQAHQEENTAIHAPQTAQCFLQHKAEHATAVDISGQAGNGLAKYQPRFGRTFS